MTTERALFRLARAGSANMGAAGAGSVAGVLLALSITHGFSKDLAGTFFAVTAAFLIVENVATLGVTTGLVRKLPECRSGPGEARAPGCVALVRIALTPVLAVSLLCGTALVVLAPIAGGWIAGSRGADGARDMLRVLAVFLPVAACNDTVLAATRGLGTMRPTIFSENLGRLCAQPLAILLVAASGGGGPELVLAWALPYLIALGVNSIWLTRLLHGQREAGAPPPTPMRHEYRARRTDFWRYTTPRSFATVVQVALKRSDVVLVAAMTTAAQAAVYATATRFVTFGLLGVAALQQTLSPMMSKLLSVGRRDAAQEVFRAATVWMMCLAWPIYLLSANFAAPLLRVFGEGYDAGREVVVILGLAMLFATACGPADSVLLMAGRSWLSLFNSTSALVLNVGLNLVLIPLAGISGAAVSWAVAIVVRNALPLVQLRRHEGLRPDSLEAWRVGVAGLLCFGLLPLIATWSEAPVWLTAGLSTLGAGAFAFLLLGPPRILGALSVFAVLRQRPPAQAPLLPR